MRLALEQVFDGDLLYALRSAVAAHAAQAGLPPGRAHDVVIAAHELACCATTRRRRSAPPRASPFLSCKP
jgi:hypothetical protein